MTEAGPVFDASPLRRLGAIVGLIAVTTAASWFAGLPLPTTPRGWVPVALAATVAALAWAWLLPSIVPSLRVRLGMLVVVGALLGWYLISPLFVDRRVVEELPSAPVAAGGRESPSASTAAAGSEGPSAPVRGDRMRVAGGSLSGIGHRASGSVALYNLGDGSHVVRLEEVDIQNGPDLFVYLVPQPGQQDDAGGVNIGRLKGNQGSHNYVVPPDVEVREFATVLIWCRAFSTPFADATLSS